MFTELARRIAVAVVTGAALLVGTAPPGVATTSRSPIPPDANYHLVLEWGGRCLEERSQDGHVSQWGCHTGPTQVWRLVLDPTTGYHRIINGATGRCLEVRGGSLSNGARVVGVTCQPNVKHQTWLLNPKPGVVVHEIKPRHSAKCLDIAHGGEGSVAHQWECHGGGNQRWLIMPER
ncbi:RICIN domain-containing protein [Umezawaea sp.]|uniref:RICIN domain-containing protein n=1 Tax=Umezawaea sp. TaxID=1955258 RepID=UPI002ED64B60